MKKIRGKKNQQKQSNKLANKSKSQFHKTMATNHLKKYQVPKLNSQSNNQQQSHKILNNPLENLSNQRAISVSRNKSLPAFQNKIFKRRKFMKKFLKK